MASKAELLAELKVMGVLHPAVLNAMANTPRELFISAEQLAQAYENKPLNISCSQTISQPYIVAKMTELLLGQNSLPLNKILEIGTGSGYQTAILSQLASKVYTIERFHDLYVGAQAVLSKLNYQNIQLKHDDGFLGWKEHAPYDAIMVTAAPHEIPTLLLKQLSEKQGRMLIPVGGQQFGQTLKLVVRSGKHDYTETDIEAVSFVPMLEGKS